MQDCKTQQHPRDSYCVEEKDISDSKINANAKEQAIQTGRISICENPMRLVHNASAALCPVTVVHQCKETLYVGGKVTLC